MENQRDASGRFIAGGGDPAGHRGPTRGIPGPGLANLRHTVESSGKASIRNAMLIIFALASAAMLVLLTIIFGAIKIIAAWHS